jgi:pimeloyl-ACP methyl ester carboxylesterase
VSDNQGSPPIFDELPLPSRIRSRFIRNVNGLTVHMLESGYESPRRPCVLLLHGFPELAFSWRKIMPALADAGYHVIAPDQRGYGRTTGWDGEYDGDLDSFRMLNFVKDALALVSALGYRKVDAVVGHDYGSPVAAFCALIRPDVFKSVVLMSAPFPGPPSFPFNSVDQVIQPPSAPLDEGLALLPRPRKHYRWYYATREANANMHGASQGVHDFLRAYYHHKSADWSQNQPHPLLSWEPEVMAEMPTYYIMDRALGMAETVAAEMPTAEEIANCRWLPEAELATYSTEYQRTGFQGGLQSYRCGTNPEYASELLAFSGKTIDVPSCFIGGASDWGVHQSPGALESMQAHACTRLQGVHLVEGAGHWVQQEQPDAVLDVVLPFLRDAV